MSTEELEIMEELKLKTNQFVWLIDVEHYDKSKLVALQNLIDKSELRISKIELRQVFQDKLNDLKTKLKKKDPAANT